LKQFRSIEQLDTAILYVLELTSSLSVLLLAFGLIASMANVLTKGSVLTDNLFMQRVWAWTQCIAIDASVAGTIIRTFRYYAQGERVKYLLYGFLSVLLFFTAAIVSNIESVQQTLNIALEAAYVHVLVPVEALIWIRSLAIVLLIVAHALRHVQPESEQPAPDAASALPPAPLVLTPELVDALRAALAQVTVAEEPPMQQAILSAQSEQEPNTDQETSAGYNHEQEEAKKAVRLSVIVANYRGCAGGSLVTSCRSHTSSLTTIHLHAAVIQDKGVQNYYIFLDHPIQRTSDKAFCSRPLLYPPKTI